MGGENVKAAFNHAIIIMNNNNIINIVHNLILEALTHQL